jgi:hypothetical protein
VWLIPITVRHRPHAPLRRVGRRLAGRLGQHLGFKSAGSGLLPGGRALPRSRPSTPSAAQCSCQRHTQGFDLPVKRAIALTLSPSAMDSTIRARQTTFAGVLRSATKRPSRTRSSAVTVISVFCTRLA